MKQYFLQPHVYACVTENATVLLDLKADEYFGLGRDQSLALADIVAGFPSIVGPTSFNGDELTLLGNSLIEQALLTRDAGKGKPFVPVGIERVQQPLVDPYEREKMPARLSHMFWFVVCYMRARAILKLQPLEKVVREVEVRKARLSRSDAEANRHTACQLIKSYSCVRPFLFAKKDKCLLDSLAIMDLLLTFGISATWVIGVRAEPFSAHSWVQIGNCVLNGNPAYTELFTPILAI